jgi:hypothetical protein
MPNQQNAGPMMDVAVVVDIDQLMLLYRLLLNPRVEDRTKFLSCMAAGSSRKA